MNKNWKMSVVTAAVAGLVACGEELPEMEGENGEGNGEEVVVEEGDTSTLVVGMTSAPDSLMYLIDQVCQVDTFNVFSIIHF